MRLPRFASLCSRLALSVALAASLSACYKSPEENLSSTTRVGTLSGWDVSFVSDGSSSDGDGIYLFAPSDSAPGSRSGDVGAPQLVGKIEGEPLYFVEDHSDTHSQGFYAVGTPEGGFRPLPTSSFRYSAGKSTAHRSVGYALACGSPVSVGIDHLSADELEALASRARALAERRRSSSLEPSRPAP